MRRPNSWSRRSLAFSSALVVLLLHVSSTPSASSEPERGRPEPGPASESESIEAPARAYLEDAELRHLPLSQLELLTVSPDPLHHRADTYTDASLTIGPGAPNVLEQVKLDMARAAVDASRAAGTLHITHVPDDIAPATPEDVEALKRQQLEATSPLTIESDPAAGVGEGFLPVQKIGPSGLTDYEIRKLNGESPLPEQAEPVVIEPSEIIDGDGAPVRSEEGQSDD